VRTASHSKMATRRISSTPSIKPDALLHPSVLDFANQLRGGLSCPPYANTFTWDPAHAARIHAQLSDWLKSGDIQLLAELLRKDFVAITHPVISLHLSHLRSLLRKVDIGDPDAEFADYDDILPSGIKYAAERALQIVFSGMWEGLAPGWAVEFKAHKRPGTPSTYRWIEKVRIETYCRELEHEVDRLEGLQQADLSRKRNETTGAFLKRTTELVQQLAKSYDIPSHFNIKVYRHKSGQLRMHTVSYCLPLKVAKKIASQAIRTRVSKNTLIYGLLAHHELNDCSKIGAVRGIVERP